MKKLACLLFFACGSPAEVVIGAPGIDDEAFEERWSQNREAPEDVVSNASVMLADVVGPSDIGRTFGVTDDNIPYPDTYWPFAAGGIGASWNHHEDESPVEKYMRMTNVPHLVAAYDWEQRLHGPLTPGVQGWWGHCNGWTAAAMLNAPLKHGVDAKKDGSTLRKCSLGEYGCVHYEIGDINALAAEVYLDAEVEAIGSRCDTKPTEIQRDADGRVLGGCKGLNPGSLMVVLGNRMKRDRLPMAINAQTPRTTDQIWNQPAYRYTVYKYDVLTEAEAIRRVSPAASTYKWNSLARGFVYVDVGIHWVAETRQANMTPVSGESTARETRFTAVLELDGPASSLATKIIGGEYVEDDSVGTDRLINAPYVWIAHDRDGGSRTHNPYVDFYTVKQLINLAQ